MKKPLMMSLTFLFFVLSIIGIILPMLPATPFLVLTAYFASKSSPKIHDKIVNSSFYKNNIGDYLENRAMTVKTKIRILATASFFLIFAFIIVDSLVVRIIIILAIIFKYYYFIFKIRTMESKTL